MKNFLKSKFSFILLFLLVIDQTTKILAKFYLTACAQIKTNAFLKFCFVQNMGIAFSLEFFSQTILIGLIVLFLIIIAKILLTHKNTSLQNLGFILIFGGGLGNLIDRIFYAGVIDFISIGAFPVFNLADIYINLGVLCLVWWIFRFKK